ncbi:type I polyketide synthase [Prauserella aidingensis]|uniref:type I polyketide synthase n=1 Tax=Prauserella aidingensis TaxID=387890 RepID=UPI0020A3A4DB|nr:type I polyketide synthase [Prauserella aidingensis]
MALPDDVVAVGSLKRDEGGLQRMLLSLGEAAVSGITPDWDAVIPGGRRVDLPTYAFQRTHYWPDPEVPAEPLSDPVDDEFWRAVTTQDVDGLADALDLDPAAPLSDVVPALADLRRRGREAATTANWRYRVEWRPVASDPARITGTWLLLVPSSSDTGPHSPEPASTGPWTRVSDALTARGATVVTEECDPATADRQELSALLGRYPEVTGVLSALAAAPGTHPDHPSAVAGHTATLALVQAQGDAGLTAPLWCLTRDAVTTGGAGAVENPAPDQALVWGLGRVVAQEYPERWGGLVDLPSDPDDRDAGLLATALAGGTGEDQLALRGGRLFARRIVRSAAGDDGDWRPHGTVLVTGGTGGLGAHTARWLAAAGAEHLVLLSRRGPDAPGAADLADELAAAGVRADITACDVTDRTDLARVLDGLPLTAVVHTAAVLDDGVLEAITPERIGRVLAVKRDATRHLHELTLDRDLDAFVLFSSMSGTFGASGQGNYAPGNAYLDAFAEYRRALGLPATSLAWGPWGGDGMADGAVGEVAERHGLPAMDPDLAVRAMARAVGTDTCVALADIDWERFFVAMTATRTSHVLREVPEVRRLLEAATPGASGPAPVGSTSSRDELVHLVRSTVAAVLGYPGPDAVEPDRSFHDLGFDSVTAVELRNRLAAVTDLKLPVTLVFDHPTPDALAAHLADRLVPEQRVTTVSSGPSRATDDDPVVIVGMACRFPGGVATPERFRELLDGGVDAIGPFPSDRGWDLDAVYDAAGSDAVRTFLGGFLDDVADFDPAFFGISPREALAMDPQQRLLLQTSWEAIERAGIDPRGLRGSAVGVFAGTNGQDYTSLLMSRPADLEGQVATGNTASVLSGRVSYTFGFEGPAVTVDTACSSSLVALHLAAQALRGGECDLALAGGVSAMATPGLFTEFALQGGLAEDGRCKAFGDGADGTGFAEGAGLLLVERLSDARRRGHPVLAVVRGSAVNQDGASNGLTAPNGPSQQRVIRAALTDARLAPSDVAFVEAHGTGTALGDPIEAQAVLASYGQDRSEPLWLGSVKSNIGHTQAAAGVAGVIKAVLALRGDRIPPTLHATEPSTHVDWSDGDVRVASEPVPWPDGPRRAGVSSFGISGTNAHVILEAGDDAPAPVDAARTVPAAVLVPVSARSSTALRQQAAQLAGLDAEPLNLAWSLARTRSAFEHRAAVVGRTAEDVAAGLAEVAAGSPAASTGTAAPVGRTVFVFPGQGAQWCGMARQLAAESPVFAGKLAECTAALAPHVEWSLVDALTDGELLERVDVVQPVLWAVMVSLAELWRHWGIRPDAVVGHSQGEIAAAVVAGALSVEDGARIVALRSRVLCDLAGSGAMASIALPEDTVRERIADHGDRVAVAAVNGPDAVVVSGEPESVDALVAEWTADGVRAKMLPVDYASHSAQVDRLRDELLGVLAPVTPRAGAVPLYSTATGRIEDGTTLDAGYWVANLRSTVDFAGATTRLVGDGFDVFVECSPHPSLTMAVQEQADAVRSDVIAVGSLRRDDGGLDQLLSSLGELTVRGVTPDWDRVLDGGRRIDLPTYPFQQQRYWPDVVAGPDVASQPGSSTDAEFWTAVDSGALTDVLALDPGTSLRDALPALSAWRRDRDRAAVCDSWRMREAWQPLAPRPATLSGTWLVLVPDTPVEDAASDGARGDDWAAAVVDCLRGHGATPVVVACEAAGGRFAVAEAVRGTGVTAPTGIVSLLAPAHRGDVAGPVSATLTAVQALGDADVVAPLWTLTTGAVAVGRTDTVEPEQHAVWGFGRAVALEDPQRWGGLVDVPEAPEDRTGVHLARVLAGGHGEDQVAVRGSGVFGRRLERVDPGPAAAPATGPAGWCGDGTVVITGGTGGLGAVLARHLVSHGVTDLLLLSRTGAEAAPGLLAELRESGANVESVACDVADRDRLAAVLDGRRVTAVVHAAGVLDDGVVDAVTPAGLDRVLRAKALGALNLHELTRGTELAAFVLFSSAAGAFGSAGQSTYAAANAHLDALAAHRVSLGLPATSIAWGAWGATGLAADGDLRENRLRGSGFRPMKPNDALAVLDRVVTAGGPVEVVADVDWAVLLPGLHALRSTQLFSRLPEAASAPEPAAEEHTNGLTAVPAADRARVAVDLVCTHAAAVLRHPDTEAIEPGSSFRDLGFDSLTAVEFRNTLAAATGVRLPATAVFDHPTPLALADRLLAEVAGTGDDTEAPVPATTAARTTEPIAIVGLGLRLPGGADDPESLWRMLVDGDDAIGAVPADRGWSLDALYDPDPDKPGSTYVREGGFLRAAGEFDAAFFGISPREAAAMDPQQRLLLETSWEAVERAGIDPHSLRGSATGVFAGINYQDYGAVAAGQEGAEGHLLTGGAGSVLSGRVSYALGLEGPAVTVDTACSASLVALHLAAQALRGGECDLALAGGATVMATPGMFIGFARQRGLAVDGRCKAFDASADGTGWGEGAGVVLVERLSDAERHGHPVLAVLRGSAMNQDGASNGLSAPNGPAQQRVIRSALAGAELRPSEVDVVEAHGTGTSLGDPIEAQAVLATYGRDRQKPLLLGSVKSNIGHTQAAAGVAGVIKTVLALRHGRVPRTLHVTEPTTHVDWAAGDVRIATETVEWPETGRPRRAGVSAFGISGTNAHVVLEQAPATVETPEPVQATVPWTVSGATPEALRAQAARLAEYVGEHEPHPVDVALTLGAARAHLEHRGAVVGRDADELRAGLDALARGRGATGTARPGVGGTAFLFPGQGSQRPGAGRDLYEAYPVFADAFDEVCARVDTRLDRPLREVAFADEGTPEAALLDRTDFTQAALFAVGVALFRLVESWGVRADALLGHSVGELAAAHVAGVLDLDDACALVVARGALMRDLEPGGAMVAVEAAEDEVLLEPGVEIAAVNGPRSVVLSGDEAAVLRVADGFSRTRRLPVGVAFHSARVEPMLDDFRAVAEGLSFRAPAIPVVSNVTGAVAGDDIATADHWVRQARAAVRFADGVATLSARGVDRFAELGTGGVLSALTAGCLPTESAAAVVPLLRADRPEPNAVITGVAALHSHGADVDWDAFFAGTGARRVELPTYAFQREHHWAAAAAPEPAAQPADGAFWAEMGGADPDHLAEELGVDPEHLREVLPALTALHRDRADRSAAEGWRYRVAWHDRDVPATPLGGRILVAIPPTRDGWIDAVTTGLAADGAEIDELEVDPFGARGPLAARLLAHPPVDVVVSLLAADARVREGLTGCFAGTLLLAQALADAGVAAPLWCLTRGGTVEQAQVWGLGRVLGLERPEAWGGLVDTTAIDNRAIDTADADTTDATDVAEATATLRGVLAAADEDQVRMTTGGRVLVRRVEHAPAPHGGDWTTRGTALVTGGTGALGARVAEALIARGAERVVLTGRRGRDAPGAAELVDTLSASGAEVEVVACDAADRDRLAEVLAGEPELRTVVHAAGVGQFQPTGTLTSGDAAGVLHGKVAGAENLRDLLAGRDLDAVVLFSSISATWGSAGQAAYAAANAHLDALAERARAEGLPATSVAWGPWADGGMAGGDATAVLDHQGVRAMAPDVAVHALFTALAADEATIAVADVDWARFAPAFTAARPRPLLDELPEARAAIEPPTAADGGADLRARLAGLDEAGARAEVTALIRAEAAAVLGHQGPDAVAADRAFRDVGFDSLTAVELRNRVASATGVGLSAAVVFDYPTPDDLAAYLLENVLGTPENTVDELLTGLADVEERDLGDDERVRLTTRLRRALAALEAEPADGAAPDLADATDSDLFDMVDKDLGLL